MRESWRECAAAMLRLYTSVLEAVDASVDDGYMRVCGDGGKVSSLPPAAPPVQAPPPAKTKKVVVNLPKETVQEGREEYGTRQPRARQPIPNSQVPLQPVLQLPENATMEAYPPDSWRHHIPPTVDVFLPGKVMRIFTH